MTAPSTTTAAIFSKVTGRITNNTYIHRCLLVLSTGLFISLCTFSMASSAQPLAPEKEPVSSEKTLSTPEKPPLTTEKKAAIDKLLAITGTLTLTDVMADEMASQMIDGLYQQQWNLGRAVSQVVREETRSIMHDEFIANGKLKDIAYDVYHEVFSFDEVNEILAFYQSPTGKKLSNYLPTITKQVIAKSREHGQTLQSVILTRMKHRFEELDLQ